jgi:hypothetical protein
VGGEDFASILLIFWGNNLKEFLSTLLFWKISIHGCLLGHRIVFLNNFIFVMMSFFVFLI